MALRVPFDPDQLVWISDVSAHGGGVKMRTSFPWALLEEYIVSEQTKGSCTFTTEGHTKLRTVDELLAEGKRIRRDTLLFQCTWKCVFWGRASSTLAVV